MALCDEICASVFHSRRIAAAGAQLLHGCPRSEGGGVAGLQLGAEKGMEKGGSAGIHSED